MIRTVLRGRTQVVCWWLFFVFAIFGRGQQIPEVNHNGVRMYAPDKPFEHITLEDCDGPGCDGGLIVNVKAAPYRAKGDGSTDDTAAIQAAFSANLSATVANTVYFPCGTYIVTAGLTFTGSTINSGAIVGAGAGCTWIKFTGTSAVSAVLTATRPAGNFTHGLVLRNLSILGNSNVTNVVYLDHAAHFILDSVAMWGANTSTGSCLYVSAGVAATLFQPRCDGEDAPPAPAPLNGLVFDGPAPDEQSTTSHIINPIVEITGSAGVGLWLKNTQNMVISGGQVAIVGAGLRLDTAYGTVIDGTLFEQQSLPSFIGGLQNKIVGSTFSTVGFDASLPSLVLDGTGNILENAIVGGTVTVNSTAENTRVVNLNVLNNAHYADAGSGTVTNGFMTQSPSSGIYNAQCDEGPAIGNINWQGTGSTKDAPRTLCGTWVLNSGTAILSNTSFTPGKSWRAYFIGIYQTANSGASSVSFPPFFELTETSNTITFPDGVATFSVNGSGQFQATGTGQDVFIGRIFFVPNPTATASGANSMKLAGGIQAAAYTFADGTSVAPLDANGCAVVRQWSGSGNLYWSSRMCPGASGSRSDLTIQVSPAAAIGAETWSAMMSMGLATAPSGSCSATGWAFSQDGHATFCNGSTWVSKI